MNKIMLLGIALVTVGGTAVGSREQPSPPREASPLLCRKWDLSALPADVRTRIHVRAEDVPPFRNEEPRLRDAKNWPATMRFGGEVCSLRITEMDNDVNRPVRSLSEIHPGNGYCLRYEAGTKDWPRVGQMYCWYPTPHGVWLTEQSSTRREKGGMLTQIYQRDPSGSLMIFHRRYRPRHQWLSWLESDESLEEIYDRDGCLVDCGLWMNDKLVGCYHLGRSITSRELGMRARELILKTNAEALGRAAPARR